MSGPLSAVDGGTVGTPSGTVAIYKNMARKTFPTSERLNQKCELNAFLALEFKSAGGLSMKLLFARGRGTGFGALFSSFQGPVNYNLNVVAAAHQSQANVGRRRIDMEGRHFQRHGRVDFNLFSIQHF